MSSWNPVVCLICCRMGKLKRMTEFEKQSSSWTAWGYDTFLKRPLLWGLSKVFSSSSLAESDTFVIPELIKARVYLTDVHAHTNSLSFSIKI